MSNVIDKDLETLSKNLYLESPDLWIEASSKINDKVFDEMILFFAIKYNVFSIVKYAIENNMVNLNDSSKNKYHSNIKEHLVATAVQNNRTEILNYLNNPHSADIACDTEVDTRDASTTYIPTFICSECNSNIFECGYSLSTDTIYKFSSVENELLEETNPNANLVICCNCSNIINNTTPIELKNMCTIQACHSCGKDLTKSGILDKAVMEFDKDLNKFMSKSTSYHCANCDSLINKHQREHFKL